MVATLPDFWLSICFRLHPAGLSTFHALPIASFNSIPAVSPIWARPKGLLSSSEEKCEFSLPLKSEQPVSQFREATIRRSGVLLERNRFHNRRNGPKFPD